MRDVVYSMVVSLDGYIATPDGGLDWVIVDEEFHTLANDEARAQDLFIYGRRLYEVMAAFWPTADEDPAAPAYVVDFARIWRDTPKVVFSQSLKTVAWNTRLVHDDLGAEMRRLKAQSGGEMSIGGASFAAACIRLDLVDEYRQYVQPVALGAGIPYWPALDRRINLRLVENRTLGSGATFLRYRRV